MKCTPYFVGHAELENGVGRHHSLPSQLSYDVKNHSYTHGIDVHNVTLTGKLATLLLCLTAEKFDTE